jgi:hypothetical protein
VIGHQGFQHHVDPRGTRMPDRVFQSQADAKETVQLHIVGDSNRVVSRGHPRPNGAAGSDKPALHPYGIGNRQAFEELRAQIVANVSQRAYRTVDLLEQTIDEPIRGPSSISLCSQTL